MDGVLSGTLFGISSGTSCILVMLLFFFTEWYVVRFFVENSILHPHLTCHSEGMASMERDI